MDDFKSQLASDNSAVFINALEFAEKYTINGVDMYAVLDTDIIHERNKRSYAEFAEGVNQGECLLYVERKNFSRVPVKDEIISINKRKYMVNSVSDNYGVLELTLTLNQSRGSPL